MIRLRAHHLLCLQGFRGLGYSPEFIQRTKEVALRIKSEPHLKIELTDKTDTICEACPHLIKGKCQKKPSSEEKVSSRDRQVLKLLGLKAGAHLKNASLFSLLKEKAPQINLKELCQSCEWLSLGYCQQSLKNKVK